MSRSAEHVPWNVHVHGEGVPAARAPQNYGMQQLGPHASLGGGLPQLWSQHQERNHQAEEQAKIICLH